MHKPFCNFYVSICLTALMIGASFPLAGCLPSCINVVTSYGTLSGTTNGTVNTYKAVPYAQPPVGALRWRAPQPLQPWTGVREANRNGPACVQGGSPTASFVTSEDCLTLNIFAPASPGPHPVMIFLHGGALEIGAGNESTYDGTTLATKQSVVVVAINYRLSFMGFLGLPQLGAENGNGQSGNQGFYDQLAALKWVKQEISKFGGDPTNVTVFGESAGAQSGCLQLASPLSDGLFKQVVMESGNCRMYSGVSQAQAEQAGTAFLAKIGCSGDTPSLDCARGKTSQQILNALNFPFMELEKVGQKNWAFNPGNGIVTGTDFLPNSPMDLIAAGVKPGLEVLIGVNKDEGTIFTELVNHAAGESGYLTELQSAYGANATTLSTLYSFGNYASTGAAMAAVFGDSFFNCPERELADLLSQTGHTVYSYTFVQPVAGLVEGFFNLGKR